MKAPRGALFCYMHAYKCQVNHLTEEHGEVSYPQATDLIRMSPAVSQDARCRVLTILKQEKTMKQIVRNAWLGALLGAAALASAHAGTLEYQGVTFTSSWTGKVLTLEIDASHPTGDWSTATALGALQLKDLGSFDNVTLTAAPGGATNWTLSSHELNANGCAGGGHAGMGLCYSGAPVALSDDMVFQFTFTGGAPAPVSPHLKVNFVGADGGRKVGSLLSENIPAGVAPVPEPQSYAMLAGGLAVMGAFARRRKARARA